LDANRDRLYLADSIVEFGTAVSLTDPINRRSHSEGLLDIAMCVRRYEAVA